VIACRVVTWNCWWRFGDWEPRWRAIGAVLAGAAPDVVGLQEVWATDTENAAARLAERLGLHWCWVPSPHPQHWQRRGGDPTTAVGNAVLSRWPIVATSHVDLAGPDGVEDGRTALRADLATPAGRLPFVTTQLSSAPGLSRVRRAQLRHLARALAAPTAGATLPPVLTGDLNALPDSDEVRMIEGVLTEPAAPDLVLVDAWRYAGPHDPGHTWDRANPHVAATGEPSSRIDYVLVGLPRPGGAALAVGAGLLGDRPHEGVWPSDHAAVVADLLLGQPAGSPG
jgi:endonuclease/exonuclease/phosphatase family metal-dependent hydrolase